MTDLFVDFGSNAPGVTREVDALARSFDKSVASTNAVAAATAKLAGQLKAEVGEMKRASAAAQDYAKSLRATQDLFTGGRKAGRQDGGGFAGAFGSSTGQLAGMKTSAMRALVNMNRDVRRTAEEGATTVAVAWQKRLGQAIAAGGGVAGSQIGGPLGGLLGRTGAQLSTGALGLSAGALAIAGTAVAGIALAWGLASTALEHYKERALGAVQATQFAANAARAAIQTQGAAGSAAADSQGKNLTLIAGLGGGVKASADKYAETFGVNDAYGAMLDARRKFGGSADAAMAIAARAASASGSTLSENIGGLSPAELDNPDLAASRLLAIQRGEASYDGSTIGSAEDAIGYSPAAVAARQVRGVKAQGELVAQGLIPTAVGTERGKLAELRDPAAKALSDAYNAQQQALEQLKAVETAFDKFIYYASLGIRTGGATGAVLKAQNTPTGAQ